MTTDDLHDRLDLLAAAADAPGRIDIDQARRGGRRALRNRRAAKAVGSVAAAGLAIAAVVAMPHLGSSQGHDSTTASSVPLPRGHSLIQRAAFGWLPAGTAAAGATQINGEYEINAGGLVGRGFQVTVFPAGSEPALGALHGGVPAKPIPAAPVAGHRAYWIEKPGTVPSETRLRWEYAPKRWTELEADGPDAGSTATVYRVARSVTFSDTRRLPFPFRLGSAPAGLALQHATVATATGAVVPPGTADMEYDGGGGYVDISVQPAGQPSMVHGVGAPNTTVDGHRAFHGVGTVRSSSPKNTGLKFGDEVLCVNNVRGLDVCVVSSPAALLKPSGGVVGLYHRLQVFGQKPSTWTTG